MTNVYFNALGVDLENLPGKKNALAEQRPFFYFHGMEDWQVFEFLSKCTYEENESPRGRDRGVSSSLILAQNRITTVVVAA
jgi:hypothetical protein